VSGPAASILVPCFRSAAFLHRALDSILAQSFHDWEAIVVDNASDDRTHEIALGYAARDPRIRAHRNEVNLGPVRNWRRCAELARGRHAALLFSDDWYAPEFLAEALPLLDEPGVGFVYSAARIVKEVGAQIGAPVKYALGGPPLKPTAEFLRASYGRTQGTAVPVSPGCAIFRRDELVRWLALELPDPERYRWLDHGAGPDVSVYLQACLAYERFGHLAEPRVYFLSHGSNLSWRPEVNRAYAVALARVFEDAATRMTSSSRPRAQLAARLSSMGEEELARRIARGLGLAGRLRMFQEKRLFARAARRAARSA